jgi:hypothetical protein
MYEKEMEEWIDDGYFTLEEKQGDIYVVPKIKG